MSIPPKGWGAVESLIYEYFKELTLLGHQVLIVNTKSRKEIIETVNSYNPDFVHCQYDEFIDVLKFIDCEYKAITSHYGYLDQVWSHDDYLFNIHREIILQKDVYIFALSPSIAKRYIDDGVDPARVKIIPNGVNYSLFNKSLTPKYHNKSIYLAKVDSRKRQGLIQKLDSDIDFAGNLCRATAINSGFDPHKNSYLGEWSKKDVYSNLTEYANLVLLSDGEAHPLVCLEALASGLGLVISEFATANLNLNLPFIDVIPEDKINDLDYVLEIIKGNREKSLSARLEILDYAKSFDWSIIVNQYMAIVNSIISEKQKLHKNPSIGFITVATGKYYERFIPQLKRSMDNFFNIENHNINFYCFTDYPAPQSDINNFYARYMGWPFDTLLRYSLIKERLSELMQNDYLVYIDSDMEFVAAPDKDIFFANLFAVQHPGFLDKKNLLVGTYEIDPTDNCYVTPEKRKKYFQGCLWGGQSIYFKKMILTLAKQVDEDLNKASVPVWHDESYLNAYLSERKVNVLPSSYAYPEGSSLNLKPIILHKDKPHNAVRSIAIENMPKSGEIIAGLSANQSEYLYKNLYLKAHEKNQRLEWELQKSEFLKVTIQKYFYGYYSLFFRKSFYKKIIVKISKKIKKVIYG